MTFLKSGYFQDGLKAIIYFIPLIYLIIKRKYLKIKYFWLLFAGLLLLLFGNLLDFFDEFESLERMFIIGGDYPLHDFFEDSVGFTLGFALLILAVYLEFQSVRKK